MGRRGGGEEREDWEGCTGEKTEKEIKERDILIKVSIIKLERKLSLVKFQEIHEHDPS